jgi:hypothetical protein
VEEGFHQACKDLSPERRVFPGSERFLLQDGIEAMLLQDAGPALLGEA